MKNWIFKTFFEDEELRIRELEIMNEEYQKEIIKLQNQINNLKKQINFLTMKGPLL